MWCGIPVTRVGLSLCATVSVEAVVLVMLFLCVLYDAVLYCATSLHRHHIKLTATQKTLLSVVSNGNVI